MAKPTRKSTRKKKRRKGIFRIFGSILLLLLLLASISTWVVLSRFNNSQSLSDVPAEVHLISEDSEAAVDIDTGPALLALSHPRQEDQQAFSAESESPFHDAAATQASSTPAAGRHSGSPSDSPGITVLLMGVDAGSAEQIDVGVRPDSLSVLHLDPNNGSCRILGVPRDSRVELPGYGMSKINHALAVGGVPYQQLVVEQYLGISIDHFGLVDFEGVVGVVDSVGGINVDNPHAFTVGNTTFAEGEIQLNGEQALQFSRYRGGSDGDFGRIDRQQLVMRALLSELGGMDAVKAVPSLLRAAEGHFKTDLSVIELITMANDFRTSCTSSSLETRSLTGAIESHPDPLFNANLSFVSIAPQDLESGVRWLLTGKESANA